MIGYFFQIILFAFIAFSIIYLTGKLTLSFFDLKITKGLKLFSNYVVGILICILLYSIIRSGFKTINIGFIPILGLIIYLYRKKISKFSFDFKDFKYDIFLSLSFLIPIFLLQSYYYFDFPLNSFKHLNHDYYYYADCSNFLKLFGIESTYHFFYSSDSFLVPYHYAELWLAAFFSYLFSISSISSYFLIVVPICISTFAIGLFSFIEDLKIKTFLKYLIVLASIFISGVFFSIYENYELTKYFHFADNGILSLYSLKLSIIYLYFLFSLIIFIKKDKNLGMIIMSTIPFLSFSFLPGLIGGIILYYFILVFSKKLTKINKVGLYTALYTCIFIFLFYQIFKSNSFDEIFSNDVFIKKLIFGNISYSELLIFIARNIIRFVRPFIYYIPFILFLLFFIRKEKELSVLFLCILLSGMFASSLLYGIMNSYQFASNTHIIINISVFIGLSVLFYDKKINKSIKYVLISLFFSMIIINIRTTLKNKSHIQYIVANHDKDTFIKIANNLNETTSKIIVFLHENDFKDMSLSFWQVKNDLLPITQYTDKNIIFLIGNPDLYFNVNKDITSQDSLFFNHLSPINQNIVNYGIFKFIKQNKIKYIYAKKEVDLIFPSDIIVKDSILLDKMNGVFYILQ